VITGFNTDIEFDGKIYHVQTEDKGISRPVIVTLVYDRGTILASKRTPYDDLLNGTLDENALAERLQKQHRTICAAIRAGRVEDLKRLSAKDAAMKQGLSSGKEGEKSTNDVSAKNRTNEVAEVVALHSEKPADAMQGIPIPSPAFGSQQEVEIIEAIEVVPDEAVEIVSEMVGKSRPVNHRLTIELLGESNFRGGEHRTVMFMVCRGSERKVVPDAQIMVKILGSTFRPLIFHARTDKNGIARVNLQFPPFTEGRAALLARAISNGEEIELRRIIAHS
jgi:hypothetical protein